MLLVENLENAKNNENLKFHHPEITLSNIWMYFSSLLCSTIYMRVKLESETTGTHTHTYIYKVYINVFYLCSFY